MFLLILCFQFYISLGLSVGGIRDFPDNSVNRGKRKPWKNLEIKASNRTNTYKLLYIIKIILIIIIKHTNNNNGNNNNNRNKKLPSN